MKHKVNAGPIVTKIWQDTKKQALNVRVKELKRLPRKNENWF